MTLFTRQVLLLLLLFISYSSAAQSIGIGTATPNTSAVVDITHTSKGLLIPRMSSNAINNIVNPAKGLIVYDSSASRLMINMGSSTSPNWQNVTSGNVWSLGGNSNINAATQFIGTTDNRPLRFRVNGILAGEISPSTGNVSWGVRTNTSGYSNIAIGTDALKLNNGRPNLVAIGDSALFNNSLGSTVAGQSVANTAIGSKALYLNTTGHTNTATGYESLRSNTTGFSNTACGARSLYSNTTATGNTAVGFQTLYSNTTGIDNIAIGYQAMISNTTGAGNSALGYHALYHNTTGNYNHGYGYQALSNNLTGSNNTAIGRQAMRDNTTGHENVALGFQALAANLDGRGNIAIGLLSLGNTVNGNNNTAVGHVAAAGADWGNNNTIVGARAGAGQQGLVNTVSLGYQSLCTVNNQVILGNTLTSSIGGYAGFSNLSDGRFKKNIQEGVKGIEFIMKLRPVTYQMDITGINATLKANYDDDNVSKKAITEKEKEIYTGFIAQEVEQAARETGYNFSGVVKPQHEKDMYSLRYAEFVVPLVKAMQEQQKMIEDLKKRVEELEKKKTVSRGDRCNSGGAARNFLYLPSHLNN